MKLRIDRMLLMRHLNEEDKKKLDQVLDNFETALLGLAELKKRYSNVKNNIKRIEKKMVVFTDQLGEDASTMRWVEREIVSIEKKYIPIDKAIKRFEQNVRAFKELLKRRDLFMSSQIADRNRFSALSHYVYDCNDCIRRAEHDIEITKRYFKNIASSFEWASKAVKTRQKIKRKSYGIQN